MDCLDFLTCADGLANSGTEAGYRSGISRVYYACYHSSVALANDLNLPAYNSPPDERIGSHGRHIKRIFLGSRGYPAGATKNALILLSQDLAEMKHRRVKADYRLDLVLEEDDFRLARSYANRAIGHVDQIRLLENV